jgi:hypothetical protein
MRSASAGRFVLSHLIDNSAGWVRWPRLGNNPLNCVPKSGVRDGLRAMQRNSNVGRSIMKTESYRFELLGPIRAYGYAVCRGASLLLYLTPRYEEREALTGANWNVEAAMRSKRPEPGAVAHPQRYL